MTIDYRFRKVTTAILLAAFVLPLGLMGGAGTAEAKSYKKHKLSNPTAIAETKDQSSLNTFNNERHSRKNTAVSGTVTRVSDNSITVFGTKVKREGKKQHKNYGLHTFRVTADTLVFRKGMGLGSFSEVGRGDKVSIWADNMGRRSTATVIWDQSIWMTRVQGMIASINDTSSSFELHILHKGVILTTVVRVDSGTVVTNEGVPASFDTLEVGQTVNVRGVWHQVTKIIDAETVNVVPTTEILPIANIADPALSEKFVSGQEVQLAGSCTGTIGQILDECTLSWEVTYYHNGTSEVLLGPTMPAVDATTGAFTPMVELDHGTNVWYRIVLTVQNGEQTKTAVRDLKPRVSTLTFRSVPTGLMLSLNGQSKVTPFSAKAVAGVEQSVNAPTPQMLGGINYAFTSWSDGGAALHTFVAPTTSAAYTATYSAI